MVLAPVSRAYQPMFVIPHVALDSAMACRVFRGMKLGYLSDTDAVAPKVTSLRFAPNTTMGSLPRVEDKVGELKHSRNDIVIDKKKEAESGESGDSSAIFSGLP
jgi:hypothetical protein